ncbi:hypothetical protein SAMN03159496_00526 [Rhizobium sp. NFR07]|nr:hypothetical protein SAMN03159496_00526 [Rhizobium sp. NFR07]
MQRLYNIVVYFCGILAALLVSKPAFAAPDSNCLSALMAAFEGQADASSCPFQRMQDGRFIGVSSAQGIFFVSTEGNESIYVRLDVNSETILLKKLARSLRPNGISGRQTAPDAKYFYYPFFGPAGSVSKKNHPDRMQFICPQPNTLSLTEVERCEDWG